MNFMIRSEENRWGLVTILYLAGYAMVFVLAAIGDSLPDSASAIWVYGGLLLITAGLVVLTRRFTKTRKWWLVLLFFSPASIAIFLIALINILMLIGVVHC
ncbi:MAG: hypothetical protein HGB35_07340 [Geobacteraceae bacterium]|nr:hypothetical protein [Geobacteraceae bacterium]